MRPIRFACLAAAWAASTLASAADCGPRSMRLLEGAACGPLRALDIPSIAYSLRLPDGRARYDLRLVPRAEGTDAAGLLTMESELARGRASTSFLARRADGAERAVRLESAWTPPWSGGGALRIGDGVTRAGAWGRAVRFGGLRWSSATSGAPDTLSVPWAATPAAAVVPSAFDLYLDEAVRQSQAVTSGPFDILDPVAAAASSEIRPLFQDLLGRHRVAGQLEFANRNLLAAGSSVTHFESGLVREGFGLVSNRYGHSFASLTHGAGIGERLSTEWRMEVLSRRYALGTAATWRWAPLGTMSLATATSQSPNGRGRLVSLGIDGKTRLFDYGMGTRWTSRQFAPLGSDGAPTSTRRASVARVTFHPRKTDAVSVSYAERNDAANPVQLVSLRYAFDRSADSRVSLIALQSHTGDVSAVHVGVQFSIPLGGSSASRLASLH